MHVAVLMFVSEHSIAAADLARAAEERNFESLWIPEHTHIPSSRQSPWPGGDELPQPYYEVMDPFVCLASAAAVTERIKLATGICLVVQRDPLQLAKVVASIDQISQGRFLFGIGGGWNAEEMADHGTDFETRFKLMRERIEAMKVVWSEDEPEYHGELVDFGPMKTWPKPVQKPHPPIHVGGGFPYGARRAIRYGNGWIPIAGRDDIIERLSEFRAMAEEHGRNPEELEISVYGAPADRDQLLRYRDAGIHRVVLGLPPRASDQVLPLLDGHAQLVTELA